MIPTRLLCCPRRIRTTTNRTKTCCATITPLDNCGCKGTIFFALLQNFRILFCQAILFCRFLNVLMLLFACYTIQFAHRSARLRQDTLSKRSGERNSHRSTLNKKRECANIKLWHTLIAFYLSRHKRLGRLLQTSPSTTNITALYI